MSDITTLYDAVHTRLLAVLPAGYKRLSDPYLFLKNTDSEKRQGYGVRVGAGENTGAQLSCDLIMRQTLTVILTRMVRGRETDGDKKAETEKQLLEDIFLVVKDFETLEGLGTVAVIASDFISHNGIEFVGDAGDAIMKIEATFNFRYREDLN